MSLVSYKQIVAVTPRVITDIDLLLNRSFELGTLGAAPTNWTVSDDATVSETRFFNRGTSPGKRSCRMVTSVGTAAEISQVTAQGVGVLNHNIICCFAFYPDGPTQPSLRLNIEGRNSSGIFQEGALTNLNSGWTLGTWNFVEYISTFTDVDITEFKLRLRLIEDVGNAENCYVDYLHFGLLHDMKRSFDFWKTKEVPQGSVHIGNGNHQSVNFAAEQMQIEFGYKEVGIFAESATDIAMLSMYSDVEVAKEVTLWDNFAKWTNQERHFERVVMTREYSRKRKKGGIDRYTFSMKADAPVERIIVPVGLS